MKNFALAASDPATIAAGAAFVDKIAAPHQLAALQAMDIKDHLLKQSAVPSVAKGVTSDIAAQPSIASVLTAPSTTRTLAEFMGIKSAAYSNPPPSIGLVLSDLETYKAV